jgi:hypothetical protein
VKVLRFDTESRHVHVELTRRNLQALLAKLDMPDSACTIYKQSEAGTVVLTAVENEEHYADRTPGPMRGPHGIY